MKTKLMALMLLAGSAAFAFAGPRFFVGVGVGVRARVYAPPVVAYAPPVAAAYVGPAYVPPCPGPGFVWTAGFYGPGRVWHAGYWGRPYGAAFVGPHYVARGYRGWRR